jgi:hypothetical protein
VDVVFWYGAYEGHFHIMIYGDMEVVDRHHQLVSICGYGF